MTKYCYVKTHLCTCGNFDKNHDCMRERYIDQAEKEIKNLMLSKEAIFQKLFKEIKENLFDEYGLDTPKEITLYEWNGINEGITLGLAENLAQAIIQARKEKMGG